jgi:hypothetical protein
VFAVLRYSSDPELVRGGFIHDVTRLPRWDPPLKQDGPPGPGHSRASFLLNVNNIHTDDDFILAEDVRFSEWLRLDDL